MNRVLEYNLYLPVFTSIKSDKIILEFKNRF